MVLRYLLKGMVLPPFLQIILLILAWALRDLRPRLAKFLYMLALISLWALATPYVATKLTLSLEQDPPIPPARLQGIEADAIVILSRSQNESALEFGEPVSEENALERIRYGAFVHRKTGLPILLSGGSVCGDEQRSLAETMGFDLESGFQISAQWLETESRTTFENASYSYKILKPENKTRIILVTNSQHMMRAKYSFEKAGFKVIAGPTDFMDVGQASINSYLPNASSLQLSRDALHEWLGVWVYRLIN